MRNEYYIVYHRHPLDQVDGNDRVVCIDPLVFRKDGTIVPVKISTKGVKGARLGRRNFRMF